MVHMQVFVRKLIELHDKYLAYVNEGFQTHTLFLKVYCFFSFSFDPLVRTYMINSREAPPQLLIHLQALKEAFDIFCNKDVAGSSSAESLATFSDNILKKGGNEKLSDEAIEETLEKVYSLTSYLLVINP